MFLVLLEASPESATPLDQAVAAFQRGEDRDENFQVVVERYFRSIQGFFAKRVRSPEDRLDLTQETFLRAYKSLDGFRGEAKLATWLFRIAYYTYRHWLHTGKARGFDVPVSPVDDVGDSEGSETVIESNDPGAAADLLDREERRLLSEAIRELPPKMRRAVMLRVYRDLSYREIADDMDISIQTVKAHLFQARGALRQSLEGHFGEPEF